MPLCGVRCAVWDEWEDSSKEDSRGYIDIALKIFLKIL